MEKGFKKIACDILGITQRSYSNYSTQNRPIIKLLEKYFSKDDLKEFLENKRINRLETLHYFEKRVNEHYEYFMDELEQTLSFEGMYFYYKFFEKFHFIINMELPNYNSITSRVSSKTINILLLSKINKFYIEEKIMDENIEDDFNYFSASLLGLDIDTISYITSKFVNKQTLPDRWDLNYYNIYLENNNFNNFIDTCVEKYGRNDEVLISNILKKR